MSWESAQEAGTYNQNLLRSITKGDLIEIPRGLYSHWALYIGEGIVVHLTVEGRGTNGSSNSSSGQTSGEGHVKIDRFLDVAGDSKAFKNNTKDERFRPLPADHIVDNAMENLGPMPYNFLYQNCEHFASWCRYEVWCSDQVGPALNELGFIWGVFNRTYFSRPRRTGRKHHSDDRSNHTWYLTHVG